MKKRSKRMLILTTLIIIALWSYFFWQPQSIGEKFIRIFLIGNIVFLLFAALSLHLFFWYRYRSIRAMLHYIADAYSNKSIPYSTTPVILIKKQLYEQKNTSYLKTNKQNPDSKSMILIVHEGQDYEFFHYLKPEHIDNLASVLIYYLQKDIPYEILYEHSKTIHTILDE